LGGWISLHRRIKDGWLWKDKPFTKGQSWIDLLLEANHARGTVPVGNQIVAVERGQVFWSIEDMANSWGWSRTKVSNFLNLLENDSKIEQKRTSKYTLLTIVNYESYQSQGQQKDISETSKEHQEDTNNNKNNINLLSSIYKDPLEDTNSEAYKKLQAISKNIF
jgi:DNA replication protein DnaD